MRRAGQITAHLCVAPQLPTDRRRAATKLGGDRPHRHARRTQKPKLFPLGEGQTPALQTTAPTRTNAPVGDHPPRALLAIRPCRNRGVADELATLQLGPEDLHVLGDHVISEPYDQHLNSAGVAITARTQGSPYATPSNPPPPCSPHAPSISVSPSLPRHPKPRSTPTRPTTTAPSPGKPARQRPAPHPARGPGGAHRERHRHRGAHRRLRHRTRLRRHRHRRRWIATPPTLGRTRIADRPRHRHQPPRDPANPPKRSPRCPRRAHPAPTPSRPFTDALRASHNHEHSELVVTSDHVTPRTACDRPGATCPSNAGDGMSEVRPQGIDQH